MVILMIQNHHIIINNNNILRNIEKNVNKVIMSTDLEKSLNILVIRTYNLV